MAIPKVIHYCWFGKNPLPETAQKCIESWKKYFPDYEIKEWNEDNFDINACDYIREAYQAKKWAFVSDYARYKIIYDNGGVYFDTDVEVIKSFDDVINRGAFMGIEADYKTTVNTGLGIAAEKGNSFYREMLDYYEKEHFLNEDGSFNYTTVVERTTEVFKKHGLKRVDGVQQIEGIYVYPQDYFNPKDNVSGKINITENTYSIHHFDATWCSEEQLYSHKLSRKYSKFMSSKMAGRTACFVAECKYQGFFKAVKTLFRKIFRKR